MNINEYKERMKDEKYKKLKVTKAEDEKEYVFISYRGNSWKKVLTEIVYKLQNDYGLRIYFDKDFASETNVWVDQFRHNMNSSYCKAFLCFFDEGYVTSYATLMELMHALTPKSRLSESIYAINFPIDWEKLNNYDKNTGLNLALEVERDVFNREFKLIQEAGFKSVQYFYDPETDNILKECDCKDIMKIIQPKNKRDFVDDEAFYEQFIVGPLKNKFPMVFEDVKKNIESSVVISGPAPLETKGIAISSKKKKEMSLPEMIQKNIIHAEDEVYVKGRPEEIGIVEQGGDIKYKGKSFSLNKFVQEILGKGSRNAYDYVYHKEMQKILNDIRRDFCNDCQVEQHITDINEDENKQDEKVNEIHDDCVLEEIESGTKKTKKESFKEMIEKGKISVGDVVYDKDKINNIGIINDNYKIQFHDEELSLNQFIKKSRGEGSYNAYIHVIHEKTGKLLDDLRGE